MLISELTGKLSELKCSFAKRVEYSSIMKDYGVLKCKSIDEDIKSMERQIKTLEYVLKNSNKRRVIGSRDISYFSEKVILQNGFESIEKYYEGRVITEYLDNCIKRVTTETPYIDEYNNIDYRICEDVQFMDPDWCEDEVKIFSECLNNKINAARFISCKSC